MTPAGTFVLFDVIDLALSTQHQENEKPKKAVNKPTQQQQTRDLRSCIRYSFFHVSITS